MNKKLIAFLGAVLLLLPNIILAQPRAIGRPLSVVIVELAATVLRVTWIVAGTFVIVMFVLAGFKFLSAQGEPGKVNDARLAVIWGVVGVAVIVLAWSAISIIRFEFAV